MSGLITEDNFAALRDPVNSKAVPDRLLQHATPRLAGVATDRWSSMRR